MSCCSVEAHAPSGQTQRPDVTYAEAHGWMSTEAMLSSQSVSWIKKQLKKLMYSREQRVLFSCQYAADMPYPPKAVSCPLIGCFLSVMSQGLVYKKADGLSCFARASVAEDWKSVFTCERVLERGGSKAGVFVRARVPHETRRWNLSPDRKRRRRRGKRMMILCATDVKVSGLSPSLDQKGADRSWRWAVFSLWAPIWCRRWCECVPDLKKVWKLF